MATYSVVRISKGHFTPEKYNEVQRIATESAKSLIPAIKRLRGLLYYTAGVDPVTNTIVNVSIWADLAAAKQMSTLPEMLALRPIMEQVGVQFDVIANYEPSWTIQDIEPGSIAASFAPSES